MDTLESQRGDPGRRMDIRRDGGRAERRLDPGEDLGETQRHNVSW